ncbi:MAG: hypothetical protein Q8P54_01135 [bacterium]|nr:hypothetical protein [bacterium]
MKTTKLARQDRDSGILFSSAKAAANLSVARLPAGRQDCRGVGQDYEIIRYLALVF